MPQITAREALADPDFQGLPLAERIKAMRAIDSDFAALPEPEQYRALGGRQTDAPKTRQLPVMTAQGPAGMRPATEDEFQKYQADNEEGAKQLFGTAATLAGGGVARTALAAVRPMLPAGARVLANPWVAGGGAAAATQAVTGDPATALQVGASVLMGAATRGAVKAAGAGKVVRPVVAASTEAAPSLVGGIAPGTTKQAAGKIYEWGSRGGWRSVGDAAPAVAKTSAKAPAAAKVAPRAAKAVEKASAPLEKQLQATLKLTKAQRSQLSSAQALEAKIVDLKTRQGLSPAQITDAVVESLGKAVKGGTTGIMPGEAKAIVEAVLKAHGLK